MNCAVTTNIHIYIPDKIKINVTIQTNQCRLCGIKQNISHSCVIVSVSLNIYSSKASRMQTQFMKYVSFYLVHKALSYPGSNTMLRISTLQRHKIHRNPKGKQSDIERTGQPDRIYIIWTSDMTCGQEYTLVPQRHADILRETLKHIQQKQQTSKVSQK